MNQYEYEKMKYVKEMEMEEKRQMQQMIATPKYITGLQGDWKSIGIVKEQEKPTLIGKPAPPTQKPNLLLLVEEQMAEML